jgi:hypothetical protein
MLDSAVLPETSIYEKGAIVGENSRNLIVVGMDNN